MSTNQLFSHLINFPLTMLLPVLTFFLPMEKRKNWYHFLPVPFALTGLSVGISMLVAPLWMRAFSLSIYFIFYYLMIFTCFALSLRLMCGIPLGEAYYVVSFSYMVQHLSVCMARLINHWGDTSPWLQEHLATCILPVFCVLGYLYVAKPLCREGRYPASGARTAGLMILEMEILYGLGILCYHLNTEWLHSLYAMPFIITLFAHERQHQKQMNLQLEIQRRENLWDLHKSQYEMTRDTIDIINRKCHDMRHQMMAMQYVADSSHRQDAIDSIRQAVRIYDTAYKTGNESLDTVLMQKALECSQNQIALSVIADGRLLRFIDPVDLYIMMANILDNAIEANRKIAEASRRAVHLSVHERKGLIVIQTENPYEGEIQFRDGLPLTSKNDQAYHGIGTRSIRSTAEKYDGTMSIHTSGGMYVLRIIFMSGEPEDANQDKNMSNQDRNLPK